MDVRQDHRQPATAQAFFQAITDGNLGRVKALLAEDPDLLFAEHDYYGSPARLAADAASPEVTDYLAREELRRLKEGTVPEQHVYGALHDLGEVARAETGYPLTPQLQELAEPVVIRFLKHEDEMFRYIAVNVLGLHWKLRHHRETFAAMMFEDPDDLVRQICTSCLGYVLEGSRDWEATRILLRKFRDQREEPFIRETAYEGLREIWYGLGAGWNFFLNMMYAEAPLEHASREASDRKDWAASLRFAERAERVWEAHVDWGFIAALERGEEP